MTPACAASAMSAPGGSSPPGRVLPADECLHFLDGAGVQVELGLVVQDELPGPDGVAERGDKFERLWMAGIYPASITSRASERSACSRSCGCRERAYSCASAWPLMRSSLRVRSVALCKRNSPST
jgi:hypothetical protein